jgi:hypothetical protein
MAGKYHRHVVAELTCNNEFLLIPARKVGHACARARRADIVGPKSV